MPKLPNKSIALIMGAIISIISTPLIAEKAILAINFTWFGISDPIFNMDIGYFFFQKPFVELILFYILALLVIITIYVAVYYVVVFNVYLDGINIQTLKKNTFIKHICTNVILITLSIAAITYLSAEGIMNEKFLNTELGSETAIYGAGITDVTIKVWGYRILAVVIIAGVSMAIKYFRSGGSRKSIIISLCSIPVYLVALFIVMTGFQFVFVKPNELDKEKQYIAYNIENTKKAYNINIDEKEIANSGVVTMEQISNNENLIENIPVITKDVTQKYLEEYQTNTGHYSYRNTNMAVYQIEDKDKLLYLSPREIENENGRSYDSKTYEFTHGYGTIMTDATKSDENGNIEYIQKSFDGSDEKITITEPRIYFGMKTNNNIIVNSKNQKEFDYPITSSTNAENIYKGNSGLKLSLFDRLILGIKNRDFNLIFNSNITENTKIITNRNIIERAKRVLPNLIYDNEPYMIVRDDGTLVWVLDAYTTSNSYPYSQETSIEYGGAKTKINYIRNSIKVIIDAYNGTMKFYLTDRSDPIAMAYYNIYPNLFMPINEKIPEDIIKHMVYPKFLYDIQAKMLTRYHNIQTEVLYRNDDIWAISKTGNKSSMTQKIGQELDSYYTMLKTADWNSEKLGLVIPYTPINKQNINAYLVGTFNGNNKLTLYKFKSDDNVLGVMQLENQIERDEQISQELASINITGSKVIKSMIVVPIDSTLLYVQPIYQVLLNESRVPVLKKVIVASGNKVAIGNNLDEALGNLVSQQAVELEVQNTESKDGLIDAIIKANKNLEESSNNKDWDLIGKDIGRLQELIKQLEKLIEDQKKNNKEIDSSDYSNTITNEIYIENTLIVE